MKVYRILRWAALFSVVAATIFFLKRPAPLAPAQAPETIAANAQSFQNKLAQLETAKSQGQGGTEVRFSGEEVSAAVAQFMGAVEVQVPNAAAQPPAGSSPGAPSAGAGAYQSPIKQTQVSFEGDVVKGQFLAEVYGKDVYVTVAGHLGAKDGYATFEPTAFKVGDFSVPVSLVKGALQKKLEEQHEQMKLPDFVGGLRVEKGELVITEK